MRSRSRFAIVAVAVVVLAGGAQAAIRAGGPDCRADVRCEAGRLRDGAAWRIEDALTALAAAVPVLLEALDA